jgi:hypothetical protein
MMQKGDVMKEAKSQYMVEKNYVDQTIQKLMDEDRK